MTSATAGYYNFPGFGVTFNFITYPKIIDEYSYKYKFYDAKIKRITDCKIYSPFSYFKGNEFEFKRIIGPIKKMIQSQLVFLMITKKSKLYLYIILKK